MGNSQYSFQFGCNDGVCPSTDCKNLFLTNNSRGETMTIISGDGAWPSPDLVAFFQACDTGSALGSDSLPCPTANRQDAQSCSNPCPTAQSFLYDCRNIAEGKACRPTGGSGVVGNMGVWNWTSDSLALAIVISYEVCVMRIADLLAGMKLPVTVTDASGNSITMQTTTDVALDMWPEFYHFYNNSYGRQDVDLFAKKYADQGSPLPQAALDALHQNFSPNIQRAYGLLNEYDFSQAIPGNIIPPQYGGASAIDQSSPSPNLTIQGWQLGYFGYFNNDTDAKNWLVTQFKTYYLKKTIDESDYGHALSQYGSPFWTQAQRQDAYRRALGSVYPKNAKDITNGQDWIDIWAQAYADSGIVEGGQSADQYEDPADLPGMDNPYDSDPNFSGKLPYKPDEMFSSDRIVRETVDTTLHGYKNECDSKSLVEEILPVGCGVVVAGVSSMIIPGQLAKVVAAGVGGVSAYSVVSSVYGAQAMKWWGTTARNDGEKLAAKLIAFGIPAAFALGLVELGYIPAAFDTAAKKGLFIASAGGISYVLLEKPLEDSLVLGGNAAEIMLSPISWVDSVVHSIFDGCDKHIGNSNLQCYCENANSKPLLSEALVEDLYGCTEKQSALRLECMHAATTNGDWGADPVHMGTCDPTNGWMDTPTACISAGEFAYQIWDKSMDPKAQNMWDQVKHCVNANNPSFLPPTPADAMCSKYGLYARQGGVTLPGGLGDRWPGYGAVQGKCYDFRAPVGQQELGTPDSYDWRKIAPPTDNSSCAIL